MKTKYLYYLVTVVVLISAVCFGYRWYSGFYTKAEVEEKEFGPFTVVYEEYRGLLRHARFVHDKLARSLESDGIKDHINFFSFDKSNMEDDTEAKCRVGLLIGDNDIARLEEIKDTYNVMTIEKKKHIVINFPYKTKASFSAGIKNARSSFKEYCEKNGYCLFPIYTWRDEINDELIFFIPVNKK